MNHYLTRDISSFATEHIATPENDVPVWSIDFTRQSPASAGLSFSRGSAAGYYDALGNWVTALSNTLRVAYNPATGLPRGFLCEESRTNYLLNSTSPATQTVTLSTGNYVLWLEGGGSCTCAAGTAAGSGFGTATATTALIFTLTTAGTVTFTVSGSVSRFQCENGTTATSFIATAASAATRAADVCSAVLGSLINPTEGTFIVSAEASTNMVMGMDNGSGGYFPRGHLRATASQRSFYLVNAANSIVLDRNDNASLPQASQITMALTYGPAGSLCVVNGKQVSATSTPTGNLAITALRIGCRFLTGATGFHNAAIRNAAYFPKALALQQLQKLTY